MTDNSNYYGLLLYFLEALPHAALARLLKEFGSPTGIIEAPALSLGGLGLKPAQVRAIHSCAQQDSVVQQAEQALAWCRQSEGHHIVLVTDPCYPPLLREIHDPPPLLFVVGQLQALLYPQLAMVGSRRCSVDGLSSTGLFASRLAGAGLSICSGMARGIDTCAHEAALSAEGVTVAVLGTGADVIYPRSNKALAQRIIKKGALISELPLASKARSAHFPKRNRIISGMSLGVIVVEAALRSGSLITARLAMEQNRELFAIPGSIRNPLSVGAHRLIQQGVALVDQPEQVLEQLGSLLEGQMDLLGVDESSGKVLDAEAKPLNAEAKLIVAAMGYEPVTLETIVGRANLSLSCVQTQLLSLELEGLVCCAAGRYVLR